MATPTYELIETTTLTSSASSVTFSSITQDYRDLVLVMDSTISSSGEINFLANGDTGSNYNSIAMYGTGSSSGSLAQTNQSNGRLVQGDLTTSIIIVEFLDYSATDKHKTALSRANDANSVVSAVCARWANTSAITSIELDPQSSRTFSSGSTFHLYGIAS